ncbi:MAG: preprotein translocase subunit SecE [Firmicutes bacterium]|nr:preprotein translocase subunit SecE [Bacillota bacterium]
MEAASVTGRIGRAAGRVGRFLRDVRAELKKVAWPNRKELISYTVIVIISVMIVAAFIGLIDLVFSQILRLIIK